MSKVTITSYNIHSCVGTDGYYSIERVAGAIRHDKPQIVCLQEVEVNTSHVIATKSSNARDSKNSPPIRNRIWSSFHSDNQPAVIASQLGFQYHVFAPAIRSRASSRWKETHHVVCDADISGNYCRMNKSNDKHSGPYRDDERNNTHDYVTGKFGIAILSKYPILEVKIHEFRRYKQKNIRNAMACLVLLPNSKLIWVVNTHLGCHFLGKEQHCQARELVEFIHSLEKAATIDATLQGDDTHNTHTIISHDIAGDTNKISGVILCGDFNSPPFFRSIREIERHGIHDIWSYSGKGLGGTFPSDGRVLSIPLCLGKCRRNMRILRLDYMFVVQFGGFDIVCVRVHVACDIDDDDDARFTASDHLPLCGVFLI